MKDDEPKVFVETVLDEPSKTEEKIIDVKKILEQRNKGIITYFKNIHNSIKTIIFEKIEPKIVSIYEIFLKGKADNIKEWYSFMPFLFGHGIDFSSDELENIFVYVCTLFDAVRYRVYQELNNVPIIFIGDKQEMIDSFASLPTKDKIDEINSFIDKVREPLVNLIDELYEKLNPWFSPEFNDLYKSGELYLIDKYMNEGLSKIVTPKQESSLSLSRSLKKRSGTSFMFAQYNYSFKDRFYGYKVSSTNNEYLLNAQEDKDEFESLIDDNTVEMLVLPSINDSLKKDYDDLLSLLKVGQPQQLRSRRVETTEEMSRRFTEEAQAAKEAEQEAEIENKNALTEQFSKIAFSSKPKIYEQEAQSITTGIFGGISKSTSRYRKTEEPLQEVITSAPREESLDIPTSTTMPQISAAVTVPVEEGVETAETSEFSQEPVEETLDYPIFAKIDEWSSQTSNDSLNKLKEVLEDVVDWQNEMRKVLEQTHHDGIIYDDNVQQLQEQLATLNEKLNDIQDHELFDTDASELKNTMNSLTEISLERMKFYDEQSKVYSSLFRTVFGETSYNLLLSKDKFINKLRPKIKNKYEESQDFFKKVFNNPKEYFSLGASNNILRRGKNYAYIRLLELTLDEIMKHFNTEPEEEYVETVQKYTTEETLVAREKKSLNMKKFL
jgi:hypothetical protein